MKAVRFAAVLTLSAFAMAGCSSSDEPTDSLATQERGAYEDGQSATVKSVDTGNTVTVDIEGKPEQVRLLNVVAPSDNNNSPSGRCLVKESADFLKTKLPAGQQITLNFDDAQVGTSGFLDAAILVGEDLVNADVVGEGFAATTFATAKDEFYPQISKAQQQAADEGKGLYSKDIDCSIPHRIQQELDAVKGAGDLGKDEKTAVYKQASSYYNEVSKSQESPASYVGSIVTLDAVKEQLENLRKELGDNYYDEKGESAADKASASATATARPGSN